MITLIKKITYNFYTINIIVSLVEIDDNQDIYVKTILIKYD